MGDIDSVTGVHLEKRQLKIKKTKTSEVFFLFVSIVGRYGKKINKMLFSEYLTNSRFCKILSSQLENVTTA